MYLCTLTDDYADAENVVQCTHKEGEGYKHQEFKDYCDLLQSAQSNQADPEPSGRTGSSAAWISHLNEGFGLSSTRMLPCFTAE